MYNEKNKVIEVNNYTKDLSLYFKEKFSYNNLNYLTNYFLYNSEGELEEKSNYQYNENGKMKEAIFNSNTEYGLNGKYEYKYNDKNELIESKYFSLEGVIEDYSTFGYDKNGNLVLSNHFNDNGDLIKRTIYKYNDKNKLIEEADYNNKDIIVKFKKNQYDQFGNIYKQNRKN